MIWCNLIAQPEVIPLFPWKLPVFQMDCNSSMFEQERFGERDGDTPNFRCLQWTNCPGKYAEFAGAASASGLMGGSVMVSRQITSHTPWLITVLCPISTYQSSKRKQNICTHWKEGSELNPECVSSFQQEICAGWGCSSLLEHEIKPELTINTQKLCFSSCKTLKHRVELTRESQRDSSPKVYSMPFLIVYNLHRKSNNFSFISQLHSSIKNPTAFSPFQSSGPTIILTGLFLVWVCYCCIVDGLYC